MSTQTQRTQTNVLPTGDSFTPDMRDRQARGQDPYKQVESEEEGTSTHFHFGAGVPKDTYEEREKRNFAMSVLDSPEKLMAYAQSENDSIAGQRLKFMRMLCGMDKKENKTSSTREQGRRSVGGEWGSHRS